MNVKPLLAEFVGAFALSFIGAGVIMTDAALGDQGPGLLGVAVAHGLILAIAVTAAMNVSGGHINPAVTAAMLVTGRISVGGAVQYIVAQCAGAALAGMMLFAVVFPNVLAPDGTRVIDKTKNGSPHYSVAVLGASDKDVKGESKNAAALAAGRAVALEAVMTFLLVFAVFGTAVDPRHPNVGGFAIGLTICADILVGGPWTGAAMNPSRSFGPSLMLWASDPGLLSQQWVYWAGPVLGGVLAGWLYHFGILERGRK